MAATVYNEMMHNFAHDSRKMETVDVLPYESNYGSRTSALRFPFPILPFRLKPLKEEAEIAAMNRPKLYTLFIPAALLSTK